jgi:hypothetical protein
LYAGLDLHAKSNYLISSSSSPPAKPGVYQKENKMVLRLLWHAQRNFRRLEQERMEKLEISVTI